MQRGQLRDIADAHQVNTGIGNAGACFIGEGLKFNNSLLELRLVRIFIFVCCDCIEVRSFDHLISRVFFAEQQCNWRPWGCWIGRWAQNEQHHAAALSGRQFFFFFCFGRCDACGWFSGCD